MTYMVDMHDKLKRRRVFLVNMLKRFNIHWSAESNYIIEEESEGCPDGSSDIPVWNEKKESGTTTYLENSLKTIKDAKCSY